MPNTDIKIAKFSTEHLDGALKLTAKAGWSHRMDDWAMLLSLGCGDVALLDGAVVGAVCMTLFEEIATIGLLIVHESMRGQGLGNRLMRLALEKAEGRECRLIATSDGLPLYRKLGFTEVETIRVFRGIGEPVTAPADVEWATQDDFDQISDIDREGAAIDRRALICAVRTKARFAVLREFGKVVGYAAVLPYGGGEVVGPVIARSVEGAKRLLCFLVSCRAGATLRLDLRPEAGPAEWLNSIGFAETGSLIAMRRGEPPQTGDTGTTFHTFALATNQYGFP
ncbi:putative N-acetyltransferase YhbS [Bradyrhizobium sp. USDA 3311]